MAARQRGLPDLGLAARNAMALAELAQCAARLGIQDASAADDQRPARRAEHLRGPRELLAGRRRAPWCPYPLLEETLRPRVPFGLHVLTQGERHGAARGRLGQGLHRSIESDHELLGACAPVEVARQRPQAVVRRNQAVAEVLDLLQ